MGEKSSNKNVSSIYKTNLTNQNRLIHVLSDSEDSDNSSKQISNNYKQDIVSHVLSDSEDSDCIVSPVCNKLEHSEKNKTFVTNVLQVEICQVQSEIVHDQPIPGKKRKVTAKKGSKTADAKEAKKLALKQRQLKPGESIKYMTVVLDSGLLPCQFGGELLAAVQGLGCQHQLLAQAVPLSITWKRQLADSDCIEETEMLLVWQWEQLIKSIINHSLCDDIKNIKQRAHSKTLTLAVYSLDGYFSYLKNKRSKSKTKGNKNMGSDALPTVTRGEIDMALTELQIQLNCSHRLVNNGVELGLLVNQFTKSIAETPFKKDKQKRQQENLDWFATGDSRDCVRIDKEGNGLMRLWQQQLCQFNLAGIDTAQAIAAVYSSPLTLLQAYDECKTEKEGELLLQNIPVRRSLNPLAPVRRIGAELSKKIYMFFNNADGDCFLSQT